MTLQNEREIEHQKYVRVYGLPGVTYQMSESREKDATEALKSTSVRGSYLDVGCGRAEMLRVAHGIGFRYVRGVEVVPDLIARSHLVQFGEVHELPFSDKSFDVVSLLDVIEHLIPGDDELACKELRRVARKHIVITANNKDSKALGQQLHINKRPYPEWNDLFASWFGRGELVWIKGRARSSEVWRFDIAR